MLSLSSIMKSGSWMIVALSSIALLAFHYGYQTNERTSTIMSATFNMRDQPLSSRKSVNYILSSTNQDSERKGTSPDDYFDLYPKEVLTTMVGAYSCATNHLGRQETNLIEQNLSVAEVISNRGVTASILPGIVYIDDLNTDGIPPSGSQVPSVENVLANRESLSSQLTGLNLESLPNGFSVLKSSDSRVSVEELITPQNNLPSRKGLSTIDKDTLIVFTTCNHIDMTVLALEHLLHSLDVADLVVIDDFSRDGTADYLAKKGFFVIRKEKAMGLTDSWNRGYQLAVSMGYRYIIYANNDVLIPWGAIHSMRKDLLSEVLVVPLSTAKGSGHNPGQTLILALEMSVDVEDYISNPNNVQIIQDALTKKVSTRASEKDPIGGKFDGEKGTKRGHDSMHISKLSSSNHILQSIWKTKPRFNGFVFAINITGIQRAAYDHPSVLFDPSGLIIGQEDKLIAKMINFDMMPKISIGAFVYHFKSITVKMTRNKKNEDGREDLSKYHSAAITSRQTSKENKSVLGKTLNNVRVNATIMGSSNLAYKVLPYTSYGNIFIQKPFQRLSVYPPLGSADEMQRIFTDSSQALMRRETVIGFATSDANRYPLAGDVFTACELGKALVSKYENIKIIHLYKGVDWYDPIKLREIDVLVTLLDDFDVAKALNTHNSGGLNDGARPTLITIAWARNWFHRWLQQPWMGNYDLLLTSSTLAQNFYDEFGRRYGYPVKCIHSCPAETAPTLSCTTLGEVTNEPNTNTEDYGNNFKNFVNVANGNAVSVFKSIFSVSAKRVPLSCTILEQKKNNFGDNVSRLIRFQYLQDDMDTDGHLSTNPPIHNNSPLKQQSRTISQYRVQVPVKVLRIGTNIERFTKKGKALPDVLRVTNPSPRSSKSNQIAAAESGGLNRSHDVLSTPNDVRSIQSGVALRNEDTRLSFGLSDKETDVLNNADYAFTGSYYKVRRNIMSFDPLDLLPHFKGVIIGSGWQSAPNVSEEFRKIAIGSLSYEDLPEVYAKVKIVVDDANHVTSPWGSVNSRVFDALSSGALVLTNGLLGSQETFKNRLPTYTTSAELTALIRYYLSNDDIRVKLIQELSQLVMKEHSYAKRGEEFSTALSEFGIQLKCRKETEQGVSMKNTVLDLAPIRAICIGVRTYESHRSWLEILLRSLVAQHSKSEFAAKLDLQIFISDTERNTAFVPNNSPNVAPFTFSHMLEEIVNRVNRDLNPDRSPQVHVVWDVNAPKRIYKNPFYGYDETDNLVDFMANLPQCEWMMMTNGDNAYNSAWFNAVAPLANDKTIDLIGWDFITHHKRNGHGQQHIRVSMKRGFVDLASVLVRTSKVIESGAKYLGDAMFTEDLFARDFYVLSDILKVVTPQAIRLLHRIFLLHQ